ncbi:MAG: DUF2332 domain-containing protein, partial [Acidimicrobiia bacterium]
VRGWAKHAHGTPLYAYLSEVIASNPTLMRVINLIEHTPHSNVLFAAVQFLLMEGADPDLARFYPSLTKHPRRLDEIDRPFTDFVLANEDEIVAIGGSRYTQTNECRRCVALLPAVMEASFESFHLVDIGTSAGLNLAIDRYRYKWDDLEWGPSGSLLLATELRGTAPRLHDIDVLSRTGLDLNPIGPGDLEDRAWLEALIWPEHHERRKRLRSALDLVAGLPVRFIAGDALLTLGDVLNGLPASEPAVVMSSFAMSQFTPEARLRIDEIVDVGRRTRPIHRISFELLPRSDDWTRLSVDDGSGPWEIGQAHPHGEWIELYARP